SRLPLPPISTLFPYTTLFRSDTGVSDNAIRSFTFTPADGVPPAVAPFAHATAAGPTLYVTGQMPTDVTGAVVGDYVAIQTDQVRSEEHTSELQSRSDLVCRLL